MCGAGGSGRTPSLIPLVLPTPMASPLLSTMSCRWQTPAFRISRTLPPPSSVAGPCSATMASGAREALMVSVLSRAYSSGASLRHVTVESSTAATRAALELISAKWGPASAQPKGARGVRGGGGDGWGDSGGALIGSRGGLVGGPAGRGGGGRRGGAGGTGRKRLHVSEQLHASGQLRQSAHVHNSIQGFGIS